ncbi:hypothetical protein [Sphingomonas bacterium]|uniref:hypothetical protein n=1 Tax=Sphingomonas bacterium TaxID=1895847 RepID=UPI001575402E|nr:hypothetical protein [Sphingomonas bacterium]
MTKNLTAIAAAMMVAAPALVASPVAAQTNSNGQPTYQGSDSRYPCKKSNGTTGTIAGGVGGALLGHTLGGGTLGTLAGAGGGALLGRHLDKKHDEAQNRKNGC